MRTPPREESSPPCSVFGAHPLQSSSQLTFQPGRIGVPAARQRADDDPVRGVEIVDQGRGHMPQPPGHPVPLHRVPDRLGDDQSDLRCAVEGVFTHPQSMHHEVGLRSTHPATHRGTEILRSRHPVPRRQHRARSRVGSRGQRTPALTATVRHDRPPGPRPHPQPEPVDPRASPVVRLKGPLALSHGCLSSSCGASRTRRRESSRENAMCR